MSEAIDPKTATKKELLREYKECEDLWGKYSCDCLGFYLSAIQNEMVNRGMFPIK